MLIGEDLLVVCERGVRLGEFYGGVEDCAVKDV